MEILMYKNDILGANIFRRIHLFFFSLVLVFSLVGCATPNMGETITRAEDDKGNVEMFLEPVDAWDDDKAGAIRTISVEGKDLFYRFRQSEMFERAWVRLGLFWHSKQKEVVLPVVVLGPPVEIRHIQVTIDGDVYPVLKRAKNFNFTPAKRSFDKELSSSTFLIEFGVLEKMVDAENVRVVVMTNRGGLKTNLSVAVGESTSDLKGSIKYLFADFVSKITEEGKK